MPWISAQDIVLIGFLAFLEGILSIDNAVVLAVMVKHLPKAQQRRALTYGLLGAVFFRLVAISAATFLIQWTWVKFVGGGYLIYVAVHHFFHTWRNASKLQTPDGKSEKTLPGRSFWKTVFLVELMDIAFAVDSILAAVALSNKLWIVFVGGMMGVVLIRYAASLITHILEKCPGFEVSAYLLVLIIGVKLILEGFHLPGVHFTEASNPAFWIFWSAMFAAVLYGLKDINAVQVLKSRIKYLFRNADR